MNYFNNIVYSNSQRRRRRPHLGLGHLNSTRREIQYYIYLLDLQGNHGLSYSLSVNEGKLPDGTKQKLYEYKMDY